MSSNMSWQDVSNESIYFFLSDVIGISQMATRNREAATLDLASLKQQEERQAEEKYQEDSQIQSQAQNKVENGQFKNLSNTGWIVLGVAAFVGLFIGAMVATILPFPINLILGAVVAAAVTGLIFGVTAGGMSIANACPGKKGKDIDSTQLCLGGGADNFDNDGNTIDDWSLSLFKYGSTTDPDQPTADKYRMRAQQDSNDIKDATAAVNTLTSTDYSVEQSLMTQLMNSYNQVWKDFSNLSQTVTR